LVEGSPQTGSPQVIRNHHCQLAELRIETKKPRPPQAAGIG
jgi:hypothetical protein